MCLALGLLFSRGPKPNALKVTGVLLLFLGFGAFNQHAPWALLHKLPIFSSQHVPSRFHYPMVLVLGLCFAAWAGGFLDRRIAARPWLDVLLLIGVAWVAADIVGVSGRPFGQAFWMEKPDVIRPAKLFEHRKGPVLQYKRRDWAPPMLLSMFANTGMIKCYALAPDFAGVGAIAADDPRYQGRAYVAEGEGKAEVVEWSPNHARVQVKGASRNALIVYNMNYDPSWRANGERAINWNKAVATRVAAGDHSIEFRYFPRTLKYSLPLSFATILACLSVAWWRRRRARRARSS